MTATEFTPLNCDGPPPWGGPNRRAARIGGNSGEELNMDIRYGMALGRELEKLGSWHESVGYRGTAQGLKA